MWLVPTLFHYILPEEGRDYGLNNHNYYILENIINYETLEKSFDLCAKGLTWKSSIVKYDLYEDIYKNSIINDFYNHGGYVKDPLFHTFICERGKTRLLCSQTIRDRVVDKAFNTNFLLPAFAPTFIYDNGASLPGKGLDFSLNRLEQFLHREYINNGTNFFYLKCDIKKYFDNISHQYVLNQISKHTKDPRIMQYFANQFEQLRIDPLVHSGEQVPFGVGLGAESNQSFGLITLNEMDHIIKEKFGIKSYVRYMDDFVLIHKDKSYLEEIRCYLIDYLYSIGLELNLNKTQIQPISEGILFLKVHYYINDTGKVYKKLYKKTVKRLRRKMKKLSDLYYNNIVTMTDIRAFYTSSLGTFKRCDCQKQLEGIEDLFFQLFMYDYITDEEWADFKGLASDKEILDDLYELSGNLCEDNTINEYTPQYICHVKNAYKLAEVRKKFNIKIREDNIE